MSEKYPRRLASVCGCALVLLFAMTRVQADSESGESFAKEIAALDEVLRRNPNDAEAWQRRGSDHFRLGHIKESIADFDHFLQLQPDQAPYHWQRGIALYYAGRFEDGAKQFELHKTVNPEDVENAAWHFLCIARFAGVEKARASLFGIAHDSRPPMMQIHALFAGKATPDEVLAAAGADDPQSRAAKMAHFYAHLYIGLWHEANGRADLARKHITLAAEKYAGADYMGDVARVHLKLLHEHDVAR